MFDIQILWAGRWLTVATGFTSRDDAEWATGTWKQKNQCFGDPFRAVPRGSSTPTPPAEDDEPEEPTPLEHETGNPVATEESR